MSFSNSLNFSDSAWHVIATTLVFLLGAYIAVRQYRIFGVSQRLALGLYVWHTIFCVYYLVYSLSRPLDSSGYFIASNEFSGIPALGTSAVTFLTSLFTQGLHLSYGGVSLIFNIIGFIGMLAFAAALSEITEGCGRWMRRLNLLIILLPGLSFWSSAIGKDALTFMGIGLATWGALNLASRYPALVVAVFAFLLARPHMAGLLLAALAIALLFASRVGMVKNLLLLFAALPSAAIAVTFGAQFAGLDQGISLENIARLFEERLQYNLDGNTSVDVAGMSVPIRLLTFLYRPLFFDAPGLLGLVVSFENLIILLITSFAVLFKFLGRKSQLSNFAFVFFVLFSAASLIILANTTSNLGIALRHKWMFLPMLLSLSVSILFRPRTT